jgi:hypothetical protein
MSDLAECPLSAGYEGKADISLSLSGRSRQHISACRVGPVGAPVACVCGPDWYPLCRRAAKWAQSISGSKLSPPNGWHYQPLTSASTLSTGRAIAEVQIAREADAHLPQSPTIAVDGDAFGRQSIVRADKRIDDLSGGDAQRDCRMGILLWNSHSFASPADKVKIFTRLQARASAVLIPFMVDQSRRRH